MADQPLDLESIKDRTERWTEKYTWTAPITRAELPALIAEIELLRGDLAATRAHWDVAEFESYQMRPVVEAARALVATRIGGNARGPGASDSVNQDSLLALRTALDALKESHD